MRYVVCFYWLGDRWQEDGNAHVPTDKSFRAHLNRVGTVSKKLVEQYINNLYYGVDKWAVHPFKFVCFTNENLTLDESIEKRPFKLITDKGVLPRMYMFSEEAGLFGHQVLALDLDIIITGPLRDLMNYDGLFCTRAGFARGEEGLPDGDIMSFKACKETEARFWNPLVKDIHLGLIRSKGGRERMWIRDVIGKEYDLWQSLTPNQVVSYKRHVQGKGLPTTARIVSCHGYPRPHQIEEQWRIENWK